MYSPRGRRGGGALEWYLQRFTAVGLLFAVIFHFVYMHAVTTTNPADLNFNAVQARLANPVWLVFDLVLITFALFHGAVGIKIALDDGVKDRMTRLGALTVLYVFFGGLWLVGSVALLKVGLNANAEAAAYQSSHGGGTGAVSDYNASQPTVSGDVEHTPGAGDVPPQETPDYYQGDSQ